VRITLDCPSVRNSNLKEAELAAKKQLEKQKRPFVVEGNLEIVSDDGELVG